MGLFVCQECGCVENTNCNNPKYGVRAGDNGFPNLHTMEMYGFDQVWEESAEYIYGEENNRARSPIRMLCSECNTGEWHGEWDKSLPTDVELAMAEDMKDRTFTSHPLFKGSYNGKMDTYTLEQFEEDNRARKLQDDYINDNSKYTLTLNNIYDDISWSHHKPFIREESKIGRNDKCPCGSGKKYKKCCGSTK